MPSSHRAVPPPEDRPGHGARRWAALLPVLFAVVAVALLAAGVVPLHSSHAGTGAQDEHGTTATGRTSLTPAAAPSAPGPVVTSGLTGAITLRAGKDTWTYPGICAGTGRFADLAAGAAVTLFDQDDQQVAVTELRAGTATSRRVCTFAFDVAPVGLGSPAYSVQIGDSTRLTERRDQLVKDRYAFSFTLDG